MHLGRGHRHIQKKRVQTSPQGECRRAWKLAPPTTPESKSTLTSEGATLTAGSWLFPSKTAVKTVLKYFVIMAYLGEGLDTTSRSARAIRTFLTGTLVFNTLAAASAGTSSVCCFDPGRTQPASMCCRNTSVLPSWTRMQLSLARSTHRALEANRG